MIDIPKSIQARAAIIEADIPGMFDVAYAYNDAYGSISDDVAIALVCTTLGSGQSRINITHHFIDTYGDGWLDEFRRFFIPQIRERATAPNLRTPVHSRKQEYVTLPDGHTYAVGPDGKPMIPPRPPATPPEHWTGYKPLNHTGARARKFVIDNLGCIILAAMALFVGCCAGMFLIQFMGG